MEKFLIPIPISQKELDNCFREDVVSRMIEKQMRNERKRMANTTVGPRWSKAKEPPFEENCRHCGKPINTELDEIFTIGYEPNREQKFNGQKIKVRFFHKDCFIKIAGEEYLP